jgi:hypothetical protein
MSHTLRGTATALVAYGCRICSGPLTWRRQIAGLGGHGRRGLRRGTAVAVRYQRGADRGGKDIDRIMYRLPRHRHAAELSYHIDRLFCRLGRCVV